VDLTAAGVLVSWIAILFNHIRLRHAMKIQDIPISKLPWCNYWTIYSSRVSLIMCIIILFTSGFSVFTEGNWDTSEFVSSYLDIPIVVSVYLIWKFHKKTRWVSLDKIPLMEAFDQVDEQYHN
jgi:amino acid transporter